MADRPPWEDAHTKLPFGAIAEDTIEVNLLHTSRGATAVARPLVDLGFDGYARRVGTLTVVPYQVKARRTLNASALFVYRVPVAALHPDPRAAILFAYFPPPGPQPYPRLFAIPVPYFVAHCPREDAAGGRYFVFDAGLKGTGRSAWSKFFVELDALQQQWLDRLPGWKTAAQSLVDEIEPTPAPSGSREHRIRGKCGELFAAGQVQAAAGHRVVVAEDRVRVDPVALLLHDLYSYRVGGLAIHTALISPERRLTVSFGGTTFFVDERLWLVILGSHPDGTFHETAFLIPSAAVQKLIPSVTASNGKIGYRATISLDPVSRRFLPYAVATADLGRVIQEKVLG